MKIMLQHKTTGMYWKGDNSWVPIAQEAMNFTTIEEAVIYACERKLTELQVELYYPQTGTKFILPFEQV